MLLALLLALATLTGPEKSGRVAILAEPFVLDAKIARELCPEPATRVSIRVDGAETVSDPLAALETPVTSATIDMHFARPGDDRALAARVSGARCVVLEGGTWLDWWHALRPYGKQSELGRALVAAHKSGANVIGVGPAGAHLGAMCLLARTTLQRPSRDPHATAQDVVLGGLALARGACIDFATDGRADPERLLQTAFDSHVDLAVWLAGPCAWVEDPDARTAVVAGDGAAFVFDARDARRSRETIEDVRVARILAGGAFDLAARRAPSSFGVREERSVQNETTPTPRAFFSAPSAGNAWNSRKDVRLVGEGRCLRITFDPVPDSPRADGAGRVVDTARLDWLPRRP